MIPLVPLKRIASVTAGQSPPSNTVVDGLEDQPFLQGNADFGLLTPNPRVSCADAPKRCCARDILLSVRAPVGALNIADCEYGIGRGLCAITPLLVDHQYLWWVLHALTWRLHSTASGSTYEAVTADDVGTLPIPHPSTGRQRAIADYLDAETARIDALILKKERLTSLIALRFTTIRDQILSKSETIVPLMRIVDELRPIMYGIVLPGPDAEDGIPIVKGGDVVRGLPLDRRLSRTTPEIEEPFARSRLREGDLVFAIRGGIGDVAEVPAHVAGANITQDVARISPATGIDVGWLRHSLRSTVVQEQAAARTTGATIRGLNIWELERLDIPYVSHDQQRRIAADLDKAELHEQRVLSALCRQVELLRERRQALITAAVTGQLDISGVAA